MYKQRDIMHSDHCAHWNNPCKAILNHLTRSWCLCNSQLTVTVTVKAGNDEGLGGSGKGGGGGGG